MKKKIVLAAIIIVLLSMSYFVYDKVSKLYEPEAATDGHSENSGAINGTNGGSENGSTQNFNAGTDKSSGMDTGKTADKDTGNIIPADEKKITCINESGTTVRERILVPDGYERVETEAGSFADYLRELPLKPHGSRVLYYDGGVKPADVHEAVLDMDVGSRDLQQCADSVIRLRAEYLYGKGLFDQIHFNFTNGFDADYAAWRKGNRIKVSGNKAYWVEQGTASTDYKSFRTYLDMVFAYAGTLSLSKEMEAVDVKDMQPGDVFIYGNTPGHCVIVTDMAKNKSTGEKIFLLVQGYMPAQEMHILKNPAKEAGDPWYELDFGENLITPEWRFTKDQLMRFKD